MSQYLPLTGRTILVTRPKEQAIGLCQSISAAGGEPLLFPALQIEPSDDAAAKERITRMDDYDWVIFVSANAARYAQKTCDNGIIPPLKTAHVAAVGASTAKALHEAGISSVLTPPEPADSEALATMAELRDVAGRRCLIVRGEGGREWLAETLRQRGARVEYAEVYRRVRPPTDPAPLMERWREGQVHAVVVASGETLSNLAAMIGFEGMALLRGTPLVTVSERVRQQALEFGVGMAVSAAGSSDAALLQAVTGLFMTDAEKTAAPLEHATRHPEHDPDGEPAQSWEPDTVTDQDYHEAPEDGEHYSDAPEADWQEDAATAEDRAPAPKRRKTGKADISAKPPRRAWIVYLVVFIVVGISAGGYFLMQQIRSAQEGLGGELSKEDREIAELNTQVADLQAVFKTLHGQVATMESRLATEDGRLERVLGEQNAQFSERLEQVRADVHEDLQGLHRMLGKTRSDWLVSDAEYLLGAALQRLHLVGDVKTAIAALEAADERLRDAAEPIVFKVREQLVNEIRILKGYTPPDLIGASSRLLALETKIKELPLFLPHAGKGAHPAESSPGTATSSPLAPEAVPFMDGIMSELGKYVSIRRLNKPVVSMLTPEEALVLREILLLKLETARMAMVRGDETLYKANLEAARAWLAENFDAGQAAVRAVDNDIKVLMEQPVQVNYPDIGKALAMLRDITKQRLEADSATLPSKPSPPPKEESKPAQPATPDAAAEPVSTEPSAASPPTKKGANKP